MLSICQICLSTDRTLQAIREPLTNWHDEICDFGIEEEDSALYCSECAHLLSKFYNFKEKCIKANKILRKWKNQKPKVRTELSQLKNEMPPSPLAFSQIKNHKVYFYQDTTENQNYSILFTQLTNPKNTVTGQSGLLKDILVPQATNLDTLSNISAFNVDASTSNVQFVKDIPSTQHLMNTNINVTNKTCELKIEPYHENELWRETEVKIEHEELDNTETMVVEELQLKNDIDSDYNNDSDNNITNEDSDFDVKKPLKDLVSDNSSDDEILMKKCKRNLKTEPEMKTIKRVKDVKEGVKKKVKKRKVPLKKYDIESIRNNLLSKFEDGELKDEEGNVIDKDCILNSLEKMHKYTLNKVRKQCLGPEPFTREAIQFLSQVQKRYGNQFSSVFTTVHLTTTEQVLEEFKKRQEHESFFTSDHKCMLCYRGFKYEKLLDYHVSEYHNPERPYACQICQMRFKDARGMCKHVAAHRVVYKCKLCPLVTNHTNVMQTHFNQHNGVKHTCGICKTELNSKSGLNAHINSVHPSPYACVLCARTFVSQYGLTQHHILKHPNEEISEGPASARCETCNITFISNTVYETHLNKSHAEISTNSETPYTKFNKTRKRQTPRYVCRVCKNVEPSMWHMKLHFKAEHPNVNTETVSMCSQAYKHLCYVCGKGFSKIRDLDDHKNLHTGAKPHACDKCPKTFYRRVNLRIHRERHFPPARECKHCGKKFVSIANLNNHIKLHIGLRCFTCEMCAKSFVHRGALTAHVRGVHHRIRRARKPKKQPE